MIRRFAFVPLLVALAAGFPAPPVAAQTPTGSISGRIVDTGGLRVPGVTVTISSPSLQGVRTTVSSENGDFIFPALQPGEYTISFELAGFGTMRETRSVAAGQPVTVEVTLQPAGVAEEVTVTGRADAFTNTVQASTNIRGELLQQLPSTRTVLGAVNLAPGVHATGPSNNVSISGSMSFENVYLLNGVQITDNIRGTPYNLFIEDAIQETTVSTSGISAEYGRFTGGIVNAVTKSGGNTFSGSYRATVTNDDWRSTTPFNEPRTDQVVPVHEFTLGGPILRDRTWFFGAGRMFGSSVSNQTGFTNIPYNFEVDEKRFEGKLTQSFGAHTARVSYTDIRREELNNSFPSPQGIMDRRSLHDRRLPQQLLALHYTGTLRNNLFLEAQYSARSFTFAEAGAKTRDLIDGTVLQDRTTGARWWSPTFCGVCTDEERANSNVLVKANYFASTARGSHNVVLGYDTFNDRRIGDNNQSGSDFHVWTSGSIIEGETIYPVMRPDASTWIIWWPVQEASRGTKFRTHSLFVNDTWAFNRHFTFNLGLRWDKNDGKDNIGQHVARDSELSPRVGLVWDPTGQGRWGVNASFARYVSGLNNSIADSTSPAGTPSIYAWDYLGPAINASPDAPRVTSDEALRTVFNWFEANGGTSGLAPWLIDVPGMSTQIRGSLRSPSADEFAVGLSRQLGLRGALRADLTYRNFNNFYAERVDPTTGQVTNELGDDFDLVLVENTNELERQYIGLSLQANYRLGTRTSLGGNYTLSRLWGTINGETVGSGPVTGTILSYPEYFDRSWSFPEGDLAADQRHRVRLWGNVDLPFAQRLGRLNLGVIQQLQSGTPYGAIGSVRTQAFVENPGYLTPPTSVTYFFTARDHFRTEMMQRTDVALNYSYRLPGADRREVFAQFQLLNAFNTFQLFNISTNAINTTVLTAVDNPAQFQAFNPFTDTPVQGTHWEYGPNFGKPTGAAAYTLPRTFQFAVGFRF